MFIKLPKILQFPQLKQFSNKIYLSNANSLSLLLTDRFASLLCSLSGLDNFRFLKSSEGPAALSAFDCIVSSLYRVKPILVNSATFISGNSSCRFFLFLAYQLTNDSFLDSVFDFDLKGTTLVNAGFWGFSGKLFKPAKPITIQ